MTVNLSLLAGAGWQFFTDSGDPLSGGKLFTYAAGTTTPLTTYTSSSGSTPNTNPIILNAAGRLSGSNEIWLTGGQSYKFVLTNANDVLIGTYDNIDGANDFSSFSNTTDPTKGDALVGFRQSNSSGNLPNAVGRTVHQKLQESVSVRDFGATGDGVTDDAPAIQAALDYVNNSSVKALYFSPGKYRIASSVTLGATSFGAVLYGDGGFSDASSSIFVDFNGVGLFNQSASVQIRGLSFVGIRAGTSVAVKNARTVNTDDVDTWISGCSFENFDTCVQHVGRGLLVTNNTFALSGLAIDISWPTSGTDGTGVQALPYGLRKWLIASNFFHSLSRAIDITGANAQFFRAATIVGNVMDIGRSFFRGPISFSTISGNTIQNANATPISISQVCENVVITGNSIGGYEGTDSSVFKPAFCISFDSGTTVNNVSITANTFQYTTTGCIRSEAALVNCVIASNSFRSYNLDAATAFAINVTGDLTRCSITGNIFDTNPGNTRAIRVAGTATYSVIEGNAWDVSQGELSNINTLVGSVVQADQTYRYINRWGVQDTTNAELQISSTKNDSAWTPATDNFGELAVYSLDGSGAGAGKRAALRAKTTSGIGSDTYWQFSVSSTSTANTAVLNVTAVTAAPETDGAMDLGSASKRYGTVYAVTGTINTSDENEKYDIREFTDAEKNAAAKLKSCFKAFKFNAAVELKGEEARVHFGVIAQHVRDVFASEGLDASRYGLFCSDTWTDESGKEHTRLGVRYDELFAFVLGGN